MLMFLIIIDIRSTVKHFSTRAVCSWCSRRASPLDHAALLWYSVLGTIIHQKKKILTTRVRNVVHPILQTGRDHDLILRWAVVKRQRAVRQRRSCSPDLDRRTLSRRGQKWIFRRSCSPMTQLQRRMSHDCARQYLSGV